MKNPWLKIPSASPYILKEDLPSVKKFNLTTNSKHKIRYHILPQPIVGTPKTATVCLLNLNPGYSSKDIYAQNQTKGFRRANLDSLNFKNKFGFYLLDPRFKNTSAYRWWYRHLKEVINKWGLEKLRRNLMCIEFFPYHSLNFRFSKKSQLASQQFSFCLVQQAMEHHKQIIIMRSAERWFEHVIGLRSYVHKTILFNPQNPCVTPKNMPKGKFDKIFQH